MAEAVTPSLGSENQAQLYQLACLSIMEASTRMGRLDATQAIFNRLNSPKAGGASYGKNLTEIMFASGQFEPYFSLQPSQIQSRQDAIRVLGLKRGMSPETAEKTLNEYFADTADPQKMANARAHVGGRTFFKGTSQYANLIQGEDRLRTPGENFYHLDGDQTHALIKKIEGMGPVSLSASSLVSAPVGSEGMGCVDAGSGGGQVITQTNPQGQGDALMQAIGMMNMLQGRAVEFRAELNPRSDPAILELDVQKTFEVKGFGEELDGTFTVLDVMFRLRNHLEVEVEAYQADPNAPQPNVFLGDPAKGIAPASPLQQSTGSLDLQWCMPVNKVNVAGNYCEFGAQRPGHIHQGIDLGGHGPDEVYAAGDGVVVFVCGIGGAGGYGRMIDIEHPGGKMTRYAHLAKVLVKKSDKVTRGQQIGIRGGSGSYSDDDYAIHLHHELHIGGKAVNPRSYLPKPGPPQA